MTKRQWWAKPRLRTDEEEDRERRVGWLELFFDLVFVVVVAELSHSLAEHISLAGVIGFILLFIPVWWIWIGGTFYNERFETNDVSNRVFVFLQMLPVAALAVFAHDALGETSTGFALAYAAGRVIIITLWLRGGWHDQRFRPVSNRYAIGFGLSFLLFVTSVFVPPPVRFWLWGLGLLIDLVTPMTTLHIQARLPHFSTSRLPERLGLFVIIVLGETLVGVVRGVAAQHHLTLATMLTGGLGMALGFGLWWVYFDFVARRQFKRGRWWPITWTYLHLPLLMGIVAAGAGVNNVVASETTALSAETRWLISGAVAAALIFTGLIELVLQRREDEPTHPQLSPALKFAAGLGAIGVAGIGQDFGPIILLSLLMGLIIIQMIYGAYVWFRQPLAEPMLET
ncbi:MAG: low temperature requirement protein A [Anaerolineae bacterium]|nr:low temperature requirement protein A [Anaerolineales bacterium]MCQ3974794.1 low temperature requirement protein A [Anaerolineae bacterium]